MATLNSQKIGLPPGSLVFVGKQRTKKITVSVIDYDDQRMEEVTLGEVNECTTYLDRSSVTWFNFDGIHDAEVIHKVGELFGLHELMLEDIMNTKHRPKLEEFEGCLFLTMKMLSLNPKQHKIDIEQVSIVLGERWVLSFQERPGDIFEPIRERIRKEKGRVRYRHTDYLVYLLIDSVVDHYFIITEHIESLIGELESEIHEKPSQESIQAIQRLKKDLIFLRKAIVPLRSEVAALAGGNPGMVEERNLRYFRDVQDHIVHVLESLESSRDMLNTLLDIYHSTLSTRMNEVMKTLTIISTIFIPLTFIAGIYGMNFEHMPELSWKYGYYAVLGGMAAIVVAMLLYFKKVKKWL